MASLDALVSGDVDVRQWVASATLAHRHDTLAGRVTALELKLEHFFMTQQDQLGQRLSNFAPRQDLDGIGTKNIYT